MSDSLVFAKHDRVRAIDGFYKDQTGSVREDVPLSNSGAMQHARVLLDGRDHGGAVHIPWRQLELLCSPVDLTGVRAGLESVAEQLYMLEPVEYPLSGIAKALDMLRNTVEGLACQVEKLAKAGERR